MSRQRGPQARHPVRAAVGRGAWWLLRVALVAAAAVAVAPVTAVAAGAAGYAWWRGWTPRRLYAAALWCLPVAAAWLIAVAVWPERAATLVSAPGFRLPPPGVGPGATWLRVVAAPYRTLVGMWQLVGHGQAGGAVVAVAPLAVPLGVAVGGLGWAYRLFRMRSGAGLLTPAAPAAFDQRQWRHQVRSARALIAAPGSLPLLTSSGQVAAGATIRSVRNRAGSAAVIRMSGSAPIRLSSDRPEPARPHLKQATFREHSNPCGAAPATCGIHATYGTSGAALAAARPVPLVRAAAPRRRLTGGRAARHPGMLVR